MYADEDSSLARGHLQEAAGWLGFGPVPGSSLLVLALKNAASLVGALAITSLPSLQPFLAATILVPVIAVVIVGQRGGDSLATIRPVFLSALVAGVAAALVRMLDLTSASCATVIPGAGPFVDLVSIVAIAVLCYLVVFSQASPLLDRLGNGTIVVIIITQSPAVTGLCASGNDFGMRVEHVVTTWRIVGGLMGTVVLGLFAGVAASVVMSTSSSAAEAASRMTRVAMRIAHSARMSVRAFGRDGARDGRRVRGSALPSVSTASPAFTPVGSPAVMVPPSPMVSPQDFALESDHDVDIHDVDVHDDVHGKDGSDSVQSTAVDVT
ncbi:hypothetical protein FNF29_06608 [Cafeteria roenbergensis]|uniref:Uncharacterized protein n=1 Tax=Cafeteria roenbergensis TaxID=33653 RepID=A0A5A8C941_CAFRO|nr:hypothetical protein FNF29_06608 [Cafeteria roenbergensis]|eukprot:KAA0148550.1 hypothetical protein FNF29_06608 [Cafeteria roenbergensis]